MSFSDTEVSVPEMDAILAKLDEIEALKQKIEDVKEEIDGLVPELKTKHPDFVAKLSTSNGYKNNFYSIRARYNKETKRYIHYVCKKDKAFGSWLKKPKGNNDVSTDADDDCGDSE